MMVKWWYTVIHVFCTEAATGEYTDDLKVKWYGYENREGKKFFVFDFKGLK